VQAHTSPQGRLQRRHPANHQPHRMFCPGCNPFLLRYNLELLRFFPGKIYGNCKQLAGSSKSFPQRSSSEKSYWSSNCSYGIFVSKRMLSLVSATSELLNFYKQFVDTAVTTALARNCSTLIVGRGSSLRIRDTCHAMDASICLAGNAFLTSRETPSATVNNCRL
jgi:hypothetical protein